MDASPKEKRRGFPVMQYTQVSLFDVASVAPVAPVAPVARFKNSAFDLFKAGKSFVMPYYEIVAETVNSLADGAVLWWIVSTPNGIFECASVIGMMTAIRDGGGYILGEAVLLVD